MRDSSTHIWMNQMVKLIQWKRWAVSGNIILLKVVSKTQKRGQNFNDFGHHFDHFLDWFILHIISRSIKSMFSTFFMDKLSSSFMIFDNVDGVFIKVWSKGTLLSFAFHAIFWQYEWFQMLFLLLIWMSMITIQSYFNFWRNQSENTLF